MKPQVQESDGDGFVPDPGLSAYANEQRARIFALEAERDRYREALEKIRDGLRGYYEISEPVPPDIGLAYTTAREALDG